MSKTTTVGAVFVAAFALLLATLASLNSAASEPRYRLDAAYHKLPPKLVAQLLQHPPKRPWLGPNVECRTAEFDGEQVGYCICFGAEACTAPYGFQTNSNPIEAWECVGPLDAIDDRNTNVCRAEPIKITVVG